MEILHHACPIDLTTKLFESSTKIEILSKMEVAVLLGSEINNRNRRFMETYEIKTI